MKPTRETFFFWCMELAAVYLIGQISTSYADIGVMPFSFPKNVAEGLKLTVTCAPTREVHAVKFQWLKDGNEIIENQRIRVTDYTDFSTLIINHAETEDSGNYTCVISEGLSTARFTSALIVQAPPIWIQKPINAETVEGKNVTFRCRTGGQPAPSVSWSKREGKDSDSSSMLIGGGKFVVQGDVLTVINVQKEDRGVYECTVSNGVGKELRESAILMVLIPARFEEKFTVKTVRQGDSAVLRCDVTGDPPLTITWFKDKRELEITELSRYEKFETISKNGINSELFIRNVDRRDGALYSCTASNSYGSDERNIKVLVVEVPAQPLDVKSLEVWAKSVSIRWSAPYTGNSPITKYRVQYWRDKQGPQTLHEEEISASQTTAVIQDLKPGTAYALAVVAENEIGHGEPSETIRFTTSESEPSGPPTDLYVEARGPTSILVKWKPPPKECWNGELKGYYVGYRGEGINQPYTFRSVEATNNESSEYMITGLAKSARYSVLVKAYNKAGSGPPSQELIIRTLDGELPKSPPLSLVGSTDSEITVKWNQVVARDDPLTGYTLHYQRGSGHWLHVPLVPAEQSSYTLTGLQADTLYHVYLTANNKHGRGQASDIIAIKTREKGARDYAFYTDISVIIPSAAALVALIVVIIVIIVYVTKSRSRQGLVKDQIKALHDQQQQYIYAASNSQRYADMDKGQAQGRPFSQGEPGTPAVSLASYASIPSRIDQDELYGGPVEVKGPYGQVQIYDLCLTLAKNYKERPSSFPRPNSKRAQTRPPPPPHT